MYGDDLAHLRVSAADAMVKVMEPHIFSRSKEFSLLLRTVRASETKLSLTALRVFVSMCHARSAFPKRESTSAAFTSAQHVWAACSHASRAAGAHTDGERYDVRRFQRVA